MFVQRNPLFFLELSLHCILIKLDLDCLPTLSSVGLDTCDCSFQNVWLWSSVKRLSLHLDYLLLVQLNGFCMHGWRWIFQLTTQRGCAALDCCKLLGCRRFLFLFKALCISVFNLYILQLSHLLICWACSLCTNLSYLDPNRDRRCAICLANLHWSSWWTD